ncbi:MAG: hypothetical protein L3J91_00080 [Thermoplasmata archaeon]|nr:hypothetical protein [Thermoplasmata archaeon]
MNIIEWIWSVLVGAPAQAIAESWQATPHRFIVIPVEVVVVAAFSFLFFRWLSGHEDFDDEDPPEEGP